MKETSPKKFQPRPPVVAVVGHVDHGKTTLLDYIRKTNVATKEAGGITQSIGAYEIEHPSTDSKSSLQASSGQVHKITFIDTPGHEAFSRMRAHGASAADLAILVVAADEGVKPQTTEAIEILRNTKTPFIVALTKIDSPNANIDKVKNELLGVEVLLEGYGGNVSWHGVSGVTGEGVPELLDLIILAGEVAGLTFNPQAPAQGFVIESKKESRRGIIAHLVLKDGTLKIGEIISTPTATGKIKILEDFLGQRVKELLPSAPAVVVGFETIPGGGEEFMTGKTRLAQMEIAAAPRIRPEADKEDIFRPRAILKADTSGSLEAIESVLKDSVEIAEVGIGEISDNDVNLAKSTGSIIVGFQVEPSRSAARLADSQQVKIATSNIIYRLIEVVSELAETKEEEKSKASLEVLAVFSVGSSKKTVGGKVIEGILRLGNNIEIERSGEVVGRGRITSLQSNKENVKEVPSGNECGLVVETASSIEAGDILRVL